MSKFRYEIGAVPAGWAVTCNGVSGPPYAELNAAVRDTLAIAEQLRRDGHRVDVRLFDIDGTGQVLEPSDAKRFPA
jgi:hypothetical protein